MELTERSLEATIKKKAEAEKYAKKQQADAELYEKQRDSEALLFERQKNAEAAKFEKEKEAEAILPVEDYWITETMKNNQNWSVAILQRFFFFEKYHIN